MVLAYAVSSRIQRRGRGWPSQTPASSTTAAAIARGTMAVSNSIRGTSCLMIGLLEGFVGGEGVPRVCFKKPIDKQRDNTLLWELVCLPCGPPPATLSWRVALL